VPPSSLIPSTSTSSVFSTARASRRSSPAGASPKRPHRPQTFRSDQEHRVYPQWVEKMCHAPCAECHAVILTMRRIRPPRRRSPPQHAAAADQLRQAKIRRCRRGHDEDERCARPLRPSRRTGQPDTPPTQREIQAFLHRLRKTSPRSGAVADLSRQLPFLRQPYSAVYPSWQCRAPADGARAAPSKIASARQAGKNPRNE
jgi:hypothetical protein